MFRRSARGLCVLLRLRSATGLRLSSGSLRVCESGSGDKRQRGNRDHKAIIHRVSPLVLVCVIPSADNEERNELFLQFRTDYLIEHGRNNHVKKIRGTESSQQK